MTRSILVNGSSRPARLEGFNLVEAAHNGEVGQGGMDFDSEGASYDINAHWAVSVDETDAPGMMFKGYAGDRDIKRGPFATDADRRFDLELVDLNVLLGDRVLGTGSSRPAETDVERVLWLLSTAWCGGLVGNVGEYEPVDLDAVNYVDRYARDVLTDAADTAGKLFFAYVDPSGVNTLFYDYPDSTNYVSAARLSSVLSDVDGATTFEARKPTLHRAMSGGRVYSGIRFRYTGGSIFVEDTDTATNYRQREIAIFDPSVTSLEVATVKANQFLENAKEEEETIECEVDLTSALVNDIRAGQRIEVKFPHLGIPDFDWRRVVRRSVAPRGAGDDVNYQDYRVTLELANPKHVPIEVEPPAPVCVSTSLYTVANRVDSEGDFFQELDSPTVIDPQFGSWVYYNIAYTVCGCPIGGGGWVGSYDVDVWFKFTAPADDPDYLGFTVTIDGTDVDPVGYTAGWSVRVYPSAPAAELFGYGTTIGAGPIGSSGTFFIPRSLINWGGDNSLICHPDWLCFHGAFTCNDTAYFGNPHDDGRLASGAYTNPPVISNLCVKIFDAAAAVEAGSVPGVPGFGAVDGVNRTFTLANWTGGGPVGVTINGLAQPSSSFVLDATALTATLDEAPPSGAIVLWTYPASVRT